MPSYTFRRLRPGAAVSVYLARNGDFDTAIRDTAPVASGTTDDGGVAAFVLAEGIYVATTGRARAAAESPAYEPGDTVGRADLDAALAFATAAATAPLLRRLASLESPLAADYWTTAFTVPGTAPTFTGSPSTSTITSGVAVAPLRIGGNNANSVDMAGDTHFRYGGTPSLDPVTASVTFVSPPLLPDGAGQAARWTPCYEFVTDAANTLFEMLFRPPSTSVSFRMVVDGVVVSDQAVRVSGFSAGGFAYVKADFGGVAKARSIRLFVDGGMGFRGVIVPPGQTVTRPAGSFAKTLVVIGDSFIGGAGSPTDGAGRLETFPNFLAQLMGADQFVNEGIGGTGHTTTFPYINRVPSALSFTPQVVILFGSRNDGSDPGIQAAAEAELAALATVPRVYVIGPVTAAYSAGSEQLRAAALKYGRPFIDGVNGLGGPFLVPSDIGSDNIHPIFPNGAVPTAGHKKLADKIYRAIRPYELVA